jgi:cytochrome oxidase Cu insertion factor (SCO1/SenC/PrrC family)
MSNRLLQRILATVLAGLLVAIGVVLVSGLHSHGGGGAAAKADSEFDGPLLPPHITAANFTLTDERGHATSMQQFRGHVVLVTFVHSQCHGACPLMVQQIKGALNDLPHDGRGVVALGISVEPAQDTRANRLTFLRTLQMVGRLHYLNGPVPALRKVWRAYAIAPVRSEKLDDHSAFVLLVDKHGVERIGYPVSDLRPEDLAHDIAALEREPA